MQSMMIIASFLVFLNVTCLSILVPGGPVENRDFSELKGFIFWSFNIFLITLGIVSFITCYLLLISNINSIIIAQVIAVLYFIVYVIDLAGIFPKSSTKMSKHLMFIEILNTSLAIFLFLFVTAIGKVG